MHRVNARDGAYGSSNSSWYCLGEMRFYRWPTVFLAKTSVGKNTNTTKYLILHQLLFTCLPYTWCICMPWPYTLTLTSCTSTLGRHATWPAMQWHAYKRFFALLSGNLAPLLLRLEYILNVFKLLSFVKSLSMPIDYLLNTPFPGRAVKRERRKGSSRRQQPAYGAAVNEVTRELLRSARSPKRENGGRRYIKHDGMIASPVGSCLCCWQLPLSPPVPPLYCSAPHCPSLSLRPGLMHSKMWLCELYIICYQF